MDFFEFLFGKKEEKTPEKTSSETSQVEKVAPPNLYNRKFQLLLPLIL